LTENFEPLFAKIEWLIISLAYMIKFGWISISLKSWLVWTSVDWLERLVTVMLVYDIFYYLWNDELQFCPSLLKIFFFFFWLLYVYYWYFG
jgi:hypothetical protein